jgi:hypothetical protein
MLKNASSSNPFKIVGVTYSTTETIPAVRLFQIGYKLASSPRTKKADAAERP